MEGISHLNPHVFRDLRDTRWYLVIFVSRKDPPGHLLDSQGITEVIPPVAVDMDIAPTKPFKPEAISRQQ